MTFAGSKLIKHWCRRQPQAADDAMFEPDRIDSGAMLLVSSVLVMLSIVIMVAQNWTDRVRVEQLMADRLENVSLQLSRRICDQLALAESTLQGMATLAGRADSASAAWPKSKVMELQRMQSSVNLQWGDTELAVLDRQGRVLAETGHLVRENMGELRPALDAIAHDGIASVTHSQFVQSKDGQALALLRPHLAADGTVAAVLVFMAPIDSWSEMLAGLRLFSDSEISLLDGQRHLLASFPRVAPTNNALAPLPPSIDGHQNLALVESPAEGKIRLVKERQIALPWPAGERMWIFRYAHPQDAYLEGWWLSLAFNGVVAVLIVAMWLLNASATRQRRRMVKQLTRSTHLMQQLLNSLATPAALVKPRTDTIYRANTRLRGRFGAQAAAGSPVNRLFEQAADWEQLKQLGRADALCMLSRSGAFRAQARCVKLELDDGADSYWLLSLVDVSAQVDQPPSMPTPDPRTGMAHQRRIAALTANVLERSEPAAILVLDFNRFALVSQDHGSAAAERMLGTIVHLLRQELPATAVVTLLGGGELAVLLMAVTDDDAHTLAQRLRAVIADNHTLSELGQVLTQNVSVGVAVRLDGERGIDTLMERAGAALTSAQAGEFETTI
jgi:diguanylate cyclase (GGDEF)-like protein